MVKPLTPRLKDPPIVEVVCGFFFSPLPGLDPLMVGKYWAEQKEKSGYKNRQLQPPVTDRPGLTFADGVAPVRSMLISDTDEYVLQIQPDRFYFNWRRREGHHYPHFNDYKEGEGVLTKGLREFAKLVDCCARPQRRPRPLDTFRRTDAGMASGVVGGPPQRAYRTAVSGTLASITS